MVNQENTEFPEAYHSHMKVILECLAVCVACSKKCLEEGHKKTAAICTDCAEICSLAVKAISGHSEFEREIIELCANACKKCAEECKKMQIKHCQECAEVCQRCTAACSTTHSMK